MVAQTIKTGVVQTIDLTPPVPAKDPDADDLTIVRVEVLRVVAKRRITLNQYLKKVFATVYDQFVPHFLGKLVVHCGKYLLEVLVEGDAPLGHHP